MELPHAVPSHVEAIENEEVVLRVADGQMLRYPKRLLPETLKTGETVHILALAEGNAVAERERLARQVLTEMLKGE